MEVHYFLQNSVFGEMASGKAAAIGIDLGTTYSCVGVFRNGNIEIIENDQRSCVTPSYVAFSETERLIGEAARSQVDLNPENTVFGIKRLIGKQFDDLKIQRDLKNCPFEVINHGGKPKVLVKFKGECKLFNPEEISAMVLRNMKETAERHLKQKVTDAVISVPAHFTDSQRQATIDAGNIAGLNILSLINEPTATVLAYGFEGNLLGEKNVLVFHMGGSTFDVSVVSINERSLFKVKSTVGSAHLGGVDFDDRMVDHFVEEFKHRLGIDIQSLPISLRKLRTACENAKRTLSILKEASIEIDVFEDVNFYSKLTRDEFEEMCMDIFCSTLGSVEQALAEAELSKDDIHDIILGGGSTLIPKIQNMLAVFFDGKGFIIPDNRVVAYGAAVQAAVLTDDMPETIKDVRVVDVAPFFLGFLTEVETMVNIMHRNTPVPYQTLFNLAAQNNGQPICFDVYENLSLTQAYNFLGKFTLFDVIPVSDGLPLIEIKFDVDRNGILSVSAVHRSYMRCMDVLSEKGCLSREDIERIIDKTKQFEKEYVE